VSLSCYRIGIVWETFTPLVLIEPVTGTLPPFLHLQDRVCTIYEIVHTVA
jgi:hypothetical protein